MARLKMGQFLRPLEPIEWPDGTEQAVRNLTWDLQEILADMDDADPRSVRDTMPKIMPLLLPGKTWEQIRVALDADAMRMVIAYASGKYEAAMQAMGDELGNGVGATAQASPPATPAATSSPASPAPTAAPCGMS